MHHSMCDLYDCVQTAVKKVRDTFLLYNLKTLRIIHTNEMTLVVKTVGGAIGWPA